MSGDFGEIEAVAGALLRQLAPSARRALLRRIALSVRASQAARIRDQREPGGAAFTPRRKKAAAEPGRHALKFLYPKGAAEPRKVFMKSWVRQGPLVTGFDTEVGAIRSFFWDQVARWLPVEPDEQNKGAGKFRRKGSIRQRAMFRTLRSRKYLDADATDQEAWIGFTGAASRVAAIHHYGRADRPAYEAKPIVYPRRELLGLTYAERTRALDMLMEAVAGAL